jgi:hypothetical protein
MEMGTSFMNTFAKKLATVAAVSASAFSMSVVGTGSAHADSAYGCPYPYVCIYGGPSVTDPIVAEFKDYTNYYQSTNHGYDFSILNTRNQDTVWIRWNYGSGDQYTCVPNASHAPYNGMSAVGYVTGIMITSKTSC